jgi:hypothetical protein
VHCGVGIVEERVNRGERARNPVAPVRRTCRALRVSMPVAGDGLMSSGNTAIAQHASDRGFDRAFLDEPGERGDGGILVNGTRAKRDAHASSSAAVSSTAPSESMPSIVNARAT